jgi:hypothetical protein
MFPNPLNNPLIVKTVLSKAQEELNESLRFRKKQFNNPYLYMWVEIDERLNIPFVCLKNEAAENIVRLSAEELLNDKDIKEQLKKIPAIVRQFINFKKIVPEMNQVLVQKLGSTKFIKIEEGAKTAYLEIWNNEKAIVKNLSLNEIFGLD